MSGRSWRLHLLDERSPFTLLPFPLVLVFDEQHFTEPDPFDYTFGNNTHLFALEGVVQKENIMFFVLEAVDLAEFTADDGVVVLHDLEEVVPAAAEVLQLDIPGQEGLNALLPLVDALDAVHRKDSQVIDPLLEQLVQLSHRQLLLLPLTYYLSYLLQTGFPRVDRRHYFLHQRGLLGHL